ncbi:Glycine/serine hydroxymethyltransferase [Trachipleistophora hominis]|uniref:glycine hydroxymethyltransferase n=1 Tax=Trachipleistophora hominis TaxID=72359 RepID=L7JT05_TRAHO|nr:Glycine/serine hydroxymethyltransferase [Trachipleistophora hominis]
MSELVYKNMKDTDIELYNLIMDEKQRQEESIELIASESYVSVPVLQASISLLHNKYSEGMVGERYYGGTDVIDKIESLCKDRALRVFGLDENVWGVNVQPYSGAIANFEIYNALIGPGGRLMGLDLFSGGHLSHGFKIENRKISVTSKYFESYPYKLKNDGSIDYEQMQRDFVHNKVNILIGGASAYPRDFDYKRMRKIADLNNAYLMADIAHISGLVACGKMNNPFEYCDVVMTTVQKMLKGPKAAMIFYRKEKNGVNIQNLTNRSVFPGCQGGPHNQTIAGIAAALKIAKSEEYRNFIDQVLLNMQAMTKVFLESGVKLLTNGTINHLAMLDMRNICMDGRVFSLDGSLFEWVCNFVNISLNKNSLPDDTSCLHPNGIRVGTVSVTTRGFKEDGCTRIAEMLVEIMKKLGSYESLSVEEMKERVKKDKWFAEMRDRVRETVKGYPIPGADLFEKSNN